MSLMSNACWIGLAAALGAARAPAQSETHLNLQAVTTNGTSAWTAVFPFTLRGVLLCDTDEMLDPTPDFIPYGGSEDNGKMGAQWQVFLQAVSPGDRGGTACWMGQNYGNQPWIRNSELSYTNEAWVAEILRLNFDPSSLHPFRAGDLVEVTARQSLFYGGKRNINEGHDIDPVFDFDIRLVTASFGLPEPEVITLADVTEPGGTAGDPATWLPIFDPTRATGAEHYQGMRVRINGLTLLTTNGWSATNAWGGRQCTVTDGAGRFFALRHPRYSLGAAPAQPFDAIGIFNQESGSGGQGTNGYELFVQQVLPQTPAPELVIGLNVVIAWPVSGNVYQLEWRSEPDTGEWNPVTNAPVVLGGMNTVILPRDRPQQFYQLRKVE
ncbi:MAG: hypothetical protein JXQ71_02295 [Verrucomicrobia bacterium]|nr:hypothetical protein [Verrucomicrobiota bacterium]